MIKNLEDFKINIRIKLSALWTAVMFCYIYGDYFELYVPNKVHSFLNGQNMLDTPIKLFIATFLLTIPALMIFLSLMLSPKLTKWSNIGIGTIFTFLTLLAGISSISEWRIFYLFLSVLESIITIIIIWQAWNWKKI
ncbi:hypothetical protein I5M32_09245 [Pedobacter sp. SD-b]|uniref:Uncharacterized protein n=1 Tax=Pedobacter segetis TaxID=2793069 RepID=A0ABS1BK39_9SPHI|nr:DUF6326 family protein [Pedobacter segetis]MBK0383142.1 hypothetical protein [Pedobacter segetis]